MNQYQLLFRNLRVEIIRLESWVIYHNFTLQYQIQNMDSYQIFLIIFSGVIALILLLLNIYILTLYLHPDDKGIQTSLYAKIIIILGLTICQAQALLVPLDVALQANIHSDTFKMGVFWQFLYMALLVFICILIPFAIFFYETDPEKSMVHRVMRSIGYWFFTFAISMTLLFVSWSFLKYIDLPYSQWQVEETTLIQKQSEASVEIQVSFTIYVVTILTFVGWIFVVFFGGVGLFALPFDFINEFRKRPKVRKSDQMKRTKQNLIKAVRSLIKQGQQLSQKGQQSKNNIQAGCLEKFTQSRKSNVQLTKFKAQYVNLSEQFSIFKLQLKLDGVNPVIPYLKLVIGIVFLLTSLVWVVQIVFGNVIKSILPDRPLISFLNQLLIFMDEKNVGLISTIVYAYLCHYMMWCVQKGSIKMGIRLPFICRFYPLKEKETALNGFLVNVLFLMIASISVTQLCVSSFPTYTRFAQINSIFEVLLKYMRFYKIFYQIGIFPMALIAWTVLSLLFLLITCNRPPKHMKQIAEIRRHHQQQRQALK